MLKQKKTEMCHTFQCPINPFLQELFFIVIYKFLVHFLNCHSNYIRSQYNVFQCKEQATIMVGILILGVATGATNRPDIMLNQQRYFLT